MMSLPTGVRIWLAAGFTDLRKGFDGLAALVQTALNENPFSGQGATRFTPDSRFGHDSTYFSASFGGGFRIPVNPHFFLRLEARGFATILNSTTAVFCRSDQSGGVCRIHGSGSSFLQGDLLAGVAYTF
ncbi:MAG: hypothetical protein JWO52_7488 [Gammaproteobacteria bacterium]|nr:hypothetical protein [Gammaproteobacteria bacterium]